MKVLISGFEPFDHFTVNPSEQVVNSLLGSSDFTFDLFSVVLPVSFERSFQVLKTSIDEVNPDFVVNFGLAASRSRLSIERIAINLMEARIPDNDDQQPINEAIYPGQADGLFSTLPIKSMLASCKLAEIECSISNSAGTYVCNYIMYKSLIYGQTRNYKSGFIHVPPTPEVGMKPNTKPLNEIVLGAQQMLNALNTRSCNNQVINTGTEF